MDKIKTEIARAQRMLTWGDNWDDEGSIGYTIYTWRRVSWFLLAGATQLQEMGIELITPEILPGPEGSMDIHWKTDEIELLVNIPSSSVYMANYYGGYEKRSQEVKGYLDYTGDSRRLFLWLIQGAK